MLGIAYKDAHAILGPIFRAKEGMGVLRIQIQVL